MRRSRPAVVMLVSGVSLALGLIALAWAVGPSSSQAQHDAMRNCPHPAKWAMSVWSGDDGSDSEQAFATCGAQAVEAAYYIDPQTQSWLRWFAGRPEVSNLPALDDMGAVLARAAADAPAPAAVASGRIAFESEHDGNVEIYVMNADGTGLTNLTNNSAGDWISAWSPDGSQIAFASGRGGFSTEIYVMNADGTGQTRLTSNSTFDWWPAWSPDGSQIAFESERDGNGEIYVMNADGTGQTRLTSNPARDFSPAWSPDGSQIAFASDRDGNDEIYVMNADGTGQTRLTSNPARDFSPAWSPDGSQIAFASDRDGNDEIYVMNADGTGQTRLTYNPGHDISPAWSPDGSQIAFEWERDGQFEVYVMNRDGTGQTSLTNNPSGDHKPAWSPDGSHIAFHSYRDGQFEIYVMNADGTNQTRLTNNPAPDLSPAWSAFGGQQGSMDNCPQPAKWAMSVWSGDDGTYPEQAFASCGSGAVQAAYYIDPQTQSWLRWFAGRQEISNLTAVNDMQAVLSLGAAGG